MKMLQVLTVIAVALVGVLLFHTGTKQLAPRYNATQEVRVTGVVQEVRQFWCPINGDEGTHLMLNSDAGILQVHVAPRRFLQGNGVTFSPGDHIAVTGSLVTYEGKEGMIAREIVRGNQTYAFRQADGRPLWVEPIGRFLR